MPLISLAVVILALVVLGLAAQVGGVDTREEPTGDHRRSLLSGGHRS